MDHLEVGRYWDENAPTWTRLSRAGYDVYRHLLNTPAFVPRFRRTLSQWVNAIAGAGLVIEAAAEPYADESTARAHPEIGDSRIVPLFLQLRCRKPQPT